MIAQYPPRDAVGNPPANLPSNLRVRYSNCMATYRALNVRAGKAPEAGLSKSTTTTTTTTTTTGGGGKRRGSGQGLLPRAQRTTQQFQPSTPTEQAQTVSGGAAEGAAPEAGMNWKLIGLGVGVLALLGGGYWWSQKDTEPDAE
jgi:hypothetical protein